MAASIAVSAVCAVVPSVPEIAVPFRPRTVAESAPTDEVIVLFELASVRKMDVVRGREHRRSVVGGRAADSVDFVQDLLYSEFSESRCALLTVPLDASVAIVTAVFSSEVTWERAPSATCSEPTPSLAF